MKHIALMLFAILAFIMTSAHAETVRVIVGEQPPLCSQEGGIVDRVVAEALGRTGCEVEYEWLPIGRMLKLLDKGSLEIYVTVSNTRGQDNPHVDFLASKGVLFYMKRNEPRSPVKRLEDLAGKTVGSMINSPLRERFESVGIIVDEGPFETLFLKLEAGRVDYVAMADVGGFLAIRKLFPGREDEFASTDFSYMPLRVGLYAKSGDYGSRILELARRGFAEIKADGTLDRMILSFFGPNYAKRVTVY